MNTGNHADADLLALEGKLIEEYTAFEAKRGKTDDEVDEWTNRMDVMERQFAEPGELRRWCGGKAPAAPLLQTRREAAGHDGACFGLRMSDRPTDD